MSTVVNLTLTLDGVSLPNPERILESLNEEQRFKLAEGLLQQALLNCWKEL
jgi:hypothetical protein